MTPFSRTRSRKVRISLRTWYSSARRVTLAGTCDDRVWYRVEPQPCFFSWLFFFCHDGTVFSYRTLMSIYFIHVSGCLFVFSFSCMLWIVMPLVLLWICFRVGSTVYTIIMRTVFDALQTHAYIHFSVCLEGCLRRGSVDNHPRVCINTRHRVSFVASQSLHAPARPSHVARPAFNDSRRQTTS